MISGDAIMAEGERSEILVKLAVMDEKLDKALAQGCDHEARIRKLEGRGGRLWDILVGALLTGIVGMIIVWATKG